MKLFSAFAAGLIALLPLDGARAAQIYDLAVTGFFSGTGRIGFTTDSGNSVGGLSEFTFTTPTASFGLSDITQVDWSIAVDRSLSLALKAVTGSISDPGDMLWEVALINTSADITICDFDPSGSTQFCDIEDQGTVVVSNWASGTLSATPAPAVPLPASAWLLVGALALVPLARRRRAAT